MMVVDASVAVKWFSSEDGRLPALALLQGREKLMAPALIRIEVAAALVKKARVGKVAVEEADAMLGMWFAAAADGPLVILPDEPDLPAAARLALELAHPIYDCLYLALAKRQNVPLVTADLAFVERARAQHPNIHALA
jgi:predicted nucleic acid-binding protein